VTDPVFVVNAAMSLLALGACAWHAIPDRGRLAFLATGVVYGVILEQLVIIAFEAYHYNAADFLLTLGEVPLVIGFGWAAIIYAGFEIARGFDLSARATPPFVALFALHIDLAIDAVAIRVPFWTWTPPGVWFGVPLGNFTGWFLVAFLFSAAWLALPDRLPRPLLAPAVLVSAVLGLVALLELWTTFVTTTPLKALVLGSALLACLGVVFADGVDPAPVDPRLTAVPALYHGFYLGLLFWFEMYAATPGILPVSLAMIGVSVLLHAEGLGRGRRGLSAG